MVKRGAPKTKIITPNLISAKKIITKVKKIPNPSVVLYSNLVRSHPNKRAKRINPK